MEFTKMACFGIAGNFALHLEQAGEKDDFSDIKLKDENAPKGIFPFYIYAQEGFLGRYCIDNTKILLPKNSNVQIESEIAILFDALYDKNNELTALKPQKFMAFNDTSLRGISNVKISKKKNFSTASKGAGNALDIDEFTQNGICNKFYLASFLKHNEEVISYGECVPLNGYCYFYEQLIKWILNQFKLQKDEGPLENLANFLQNKPEQILISLGATRYEKDCEKRFLKQGDEVAIVCFNAQMYSVEQIKNLVFSDKNFDKNNISLLRQKVINE